MKRNCEFTNSNAQKFENNTVIIKLMKLQSDIVG